MDSFASEWFNTSGNKSSDINSKCCVDTPQLGGKEGAEPLCREQTLNKENQPQAHTIINTYPLKRSGPSDSTLFSVSFNESNLTAELLTWNELAVTVSSMKHKS